MSKPPKAPTLPQERPKPVTVKPPFAEPRADGWPGFPAPLPRRDWLISGRLCLDTEREDSRKWRARHAG